MRELRTIDLNAPDTWAPDVWRAFERAQHERVQAQVTVTDDRRHQGNKLVHPAVKYSNGTAVIETHHGIDEVVTPQDHLRQHGIDTRPVSEKALGEALSWADTPGPFIGPFTAEEGRLI